MSKILDLVLAGTPPQFDNDTSLATTAFVQSALGNMAGSVVITGATVLTAAQVGKPFQVSGAGPYAVTLPLVASVPDGATIELVVSASGTITVQRQGSDQIYPNMGSAVNSFTLVAGDSAVLKKINGVWGLVGGSAAMRSSGGDFGALLARPGYQKLPSGIILQWGTTPASSASAGVATTFQIAFPNACWIVELQVSASNSGYMASVETQSTTGFTSSMYSATTTRAAGITAYYLAVGY